AFFVPQPLDSVWCIFYKVTAADALIWISSVMSAFLFSLLPFADTPFAVCIVHAVTGLTLGSLFPLFVSKVVPLVTPQLKMS
ncbi:MFS transporter, partial [Bacillus licheniformis]